MDPVSGRRDVTPAVVRYQVWDGSVERVAGVERAKENIRGGRVTETGTAMAMGD